MLSTVWFGIEVGLDLPWKSRDVIQDLIRQNDYHEGGCQKAQLVLFIMKLLSFLEVMVLTSQIIKFFSTVPTVYIFSAFRNTLIY